MDSMNSSEAMPPDLTDSGMNMTNLTVAYDFLQDILDYTGFQPLDQTIAEAFWYGIVIVIGTAAILNIIQWATLKIRIRAAAANRPRPATASNPITKLIAGVTAMVRELSYPQTTPSNSYFIKIPPFGTMILLLGYLGFILGLEFYNDWVDGAQHWEAFGLRAALLTVAQLPLLILLAGKNNLIGLLVGVSYERLQILHRWVARTLFLTATLHMANQLYGWGVYGLVSLERDTDTCWPTGFAAWSILLWINVSTIAPFRNWHYEFFVIQHLLTFFGFIIAVMIHIPVFYSRVYVYIPIGFYLFDRLVRTARYVFHNISPGKATLTDYDDVTKIQVRSSRITSWSPGQHVLLCLPGIAFGQSHPATIASVPTSHNGDLIFFLRAHKGFTKKVLQYAAKRKPDEEKPQDQSDIQQQTFLALIDGPYGGSHSDFAAFDTLVLIAGSTGVTFTLSILLDIAHRASLQKLPLRKILFVWVMKNIRCKEWVEAEISAAAEKLYSVGIDTEVQLFITCDTLLTDESSSKSPGCTCTTFPCCCTDLKLADPDGIEEIGEPSSETPTRQRQLSLCCARPDFNGLLGKCLDEAEGETAVAVCGPLGMASAVRWTVAAASDSRAVHKGSSAEGVYLHVECFGW